MNKRLDTRSAIAAYKAAFDNHPKPIPNSFWEDPALKHASYLGTREQLIEEMQRAIDQGRPMDFGEFARRSFEYSEAVQRRRMLNSVIPEADDQVLDDTPGICFTQLMQDWDRTAGDTE